jgi:hypothetical protein
MAFGTTHVYSYDVWIPLGTLYLNLALFSFPCGSGTPDVGPKSKPLHLLYHFLLNRGCNLVYAALVPAAFSPARDGHL